jgi:hypothetical protein
MVQVTYIILKIETKKYNNIKTFAPFISLIQIIIFANYHIRKLS